MKKVLGLAGSPRKNGNTTALIKAFLVGVATAGFDTELVALPALHINPCRACDGCAQDGFCIIDDDMQALYEKLKDAQGLVLAAPVYFGNLPAQVKAFIDRFQSWWQAKYQLHKPFIKVKDNVPGFFICVGALKNSDHCRQADKVLAVFFNVANIHKQGSLCYQGFDEPGSINKHPTALEECRLAGKRFIS